MPRYIYQSGPWYRGGIPRSYVPPTVFASVGCATCLLFSSVFLIFSGGAMFGSSRSMEERRNEPPFDTEFFKKHRDNTENVIGTVGAVFLGIGCTMFAIAIALCVVAACIARKQEQNRHAGQQNPSSTATVHPPPPSTYPHQPPSQNAYPPAGTYPAQPVGSYVPMGGQYQYPAQPADYPPPYSSAPPLTGNRYPTPSYTQPDAPNAPPQGAGDIEKQPLH